MRFLVEAIESGGVLGVKPGTPPDFVRQVFGGGYMADDQDGFTRWDYGLIEVTFIKNPEWECKFLTIEMHRMITAVPDDVPSAVIERYGEIPLTVQVGELVSQLNRRGLEAARIADGADQDFSRYEVLGTGCVIHVVDSREECEGWPGYGEVWSVSINDVDEVWRRPLIGQ